MSKCTGRLSTCTCSPFFETVIVGALRRSTHALNYFSFDLLGGGDGPALANFLQYYFCGMTLLQLRVNRPVHCIILTLLLVDEKDYFESDGIHTQKNIFGIE